MRISRLSAVAFTLFLVGGLVATADTVHLRNGNSIEGIVIGETSDRVRVRLPFGELELARPTIERVVREDSAFAEFVARRDELITRTGGASEWVGLARWAWSGGLVYSAKEAVTMAAAIDPHAEGLAELMAALGFVFDETLGRWISSDEFMERRGYVLTDGHWVDASELAQQRADRRQLELSAERERQQARLSQALEYLAISQWIQVEESRRLRDDRLAYGGVPIYIGAPVGVLAGGWYGVSSTRTGHYKAIRHSRFGSTHSTGSLSSPPSG